MDAVADTPWARGAFLLGCLACWLVLANYDGIIHDGTLYSFQSLAHLTPALGQDVYLRFGSQDAFTIYSSLYAPLIEWFDLENAALVMTQLSQALLLFGAWFAARALAGPRVGLLCLAVVLALPSSYGASRVFHYFEMFTTPRPLAEACVLIAVGTCVLRRGWPTLLLCAAGFALHPVVMLPGVAVIALLWFGHGRPALFAPKTLTLVALGTVVIGLLAALALPRMDDAWLALVRDRVPYLFPTRWSIDDWALLAPRAATLLVGARLLAESPLRRVLAITLSVLTAALVASMLFADTLHVTLAIQAQLWRATWLASLVATLSLGALALNLWPDARGRAVLLALTGAWLADSNVATFALCAFACATALLRPPSAIAQRWLTIASIGGLLIGFGSAASSVYALFGSDFMWEPSVGRVINTLRSVALSPLSGLLFAAALYWLCMSAVSRVARLALAAVFALVVLTVSVRAWNEWLDSRLPQATYAAFSAWRTRIPLTAELYCGDDARTCWILLQRRSYVSATQSVGVVFSREAALELDRRAHELAAIANPSELMSWEPRASSARGGGITQACRDSRLDFVVMDAATATPEASVSRLKNLRLFDCSSLRH